MFLMMCVHVVSSQSTSYLTYVSDRLTHSAPAASTNHTITFTLTQAVPAGGAVELLFDEGGITIPAALDYTDVDMAFAAVAGGPYTERPLSWLQSAGTDDVTVTSGANGSVRFDLNTSVGIAAGNEVVVEIGTNATYGALGDQQTTLINATGTYPVTIYTYDASDIEIDYGRTVFVVVEPVTAGPVDTTDTDPPIIISSWPSGILQTGTEAAEMYVETNELATCKYATSSMSYSLMPYTFWSTSTSDYALWNFAQLTGLTDGESYIYYVRCIDFRLNEMNPDYIIAFEVGIPPGSSTTTSTSTSVGTGIGDVASSTCIGDQCVGDDIGSGSGSTGTGDGSSPTGGDNSGSGNGGGSSGGDYLPQADVMIDGWAYPNSTVYLLRDGVEVGTESPGGDAYFSNLTEGLDRGSYSFSVYAIDAKNGRSATISTTLWLQQDTYNEISNVMLPPTVHVVENSVAPGAPLEVSGYTAPRATVTTWLRPKLAEVTSADIVATTTATAAGTWALTISTTGLSQGTYELIAQAVMPDGTVESDKSLRKTIGIGVDVGADGDCISIGDLNCDGYVNLVDFSILLFNWNTSSATADINGDGLVSLPDFSIMLYNWTG